MKKKKSVRKQLLAIFRSIDDYKNKQKKLSPRSQKGHFPKGTLPLASDHLQHAPWPPPLYPAFNPGSCKDNQTVMVKMSSSYRIS